MINTNTGSIKINEGLEITLEYTFEDFKKNEYYAGQDGIRIISIKDVQMIDKKKYRVSFCFRNDKIAFVSLMNCDTEITFEDEPQRKIIHDKILKEYGIESGKRYKWGQVVSHYDPKGNISSIIISWNIDNED